MPPISSSRSVWFSTLLIFLFFWNIFHNSDTLAPSSIEEIAEIPQETPVEVEDLPLIYLDHAQPEIYEPEPLADPGTEGDDHFYAKPPGEGHSWKQTKKPKVPSTENIKPPSTIQWGDQQLEADGKPISPDQFTDISPPNAALDPAIISYNAHQGNNHAQDSHMNSNLPDRPLILYAYTEGPEARINLKFFIKHGLQATSDFIFILSGLTDAISLFPSPMPGNIRTVQRQNECQDLRAQVQVLLKHEGALIKKYKKFILMNANVRGPFLPSWSKQCWTEGYLGKLNDSVKLVGMSYDCYGGRNHVQSSLWAMDSEGLATVLTLGEINECFQSPEAAKLEETQVLSLLEAKGYQVDVLAQPGRAISAGKLDGSPSKDSAGVDSNKPESIPSSQSTSAGLPAPNDPGISEGHESGKNSANLQSLGPSITASPFSKLGKSVNEVNGISSSPSSTPPIHNSKLPQNLKAESANVENLEGAFGRHEADRTNSFEESDTAATSSEMPDKLTDSVDIADLSDSGTEENIIPPAAGLPTDLKILGILTASDQNSFSTINYITSIKVVSTTGSETAQSRARPTITANKDDKFRKFADSIAVNLNVEDIHVPAAQPGKSSKIAIGNQAKDPTTGDLGPSIDALADSNSKSEFDSGSTQLDIGIKQFQPDNFEDEALQTDNMQLDSKSSSIPPSLDSLLDEQPPAELSASASSVEDNLSDEEFAVDNAKAVASLNLDAPSTEEEERPENMPISLDIDKRDGLSTEVPDPMFVECTGEYVELHPYASMFVNTNNDAENGTLSKLTEEHNARVISSYDVCF